MGIKGFEVLREKPMKTSALMRVKAVQSALDFQFSNERVRHVGLCTWLEYGVDPSSSQKKPRMVALRSSAICWSEFRREPLEWRSCKMRSVSHFFLLTWAIFFGAVLAEFASFHSSERCLVRRILLDLWSSWWRQR